MANDIRNDGYVTGGVRIVLRGEALLLLVASVALYGHLHASWGWFAALFFVPDLALLAYLVGPALGARAYNVTHSSIGPLVLAIAGFVAQPALVPYALIWFAHIGLDRALGYGLKYREGFGYTHLGLVGRLKGTRTSGVSAPDVA